MVIELGINNEIDAIRQSAEWLALDNVGRIEMLNNYEDNLEQLSEEEYDGGFDKWKQDNTDFMNYLDATRKDVYDTSMNEIAQKRDRWNEEWFQDFTNPEGRGLLRGYVERIGEGMWTSAGALAKVFGFDDISEEYYKNAKLIHAGWDELGNKMAEIGLKAEKAGIPVANELASFVAEFFPALKAHDKDLIKEIMEYEGVLDEDGNMRTFESTQIAGMLGHFARIMVIMKGVEGSLFSTGKVFQTGRALADVTARQVAGVYKGANIYAMQYAVASGISRGLELDLTADSLRDIGITAAGTYAAMLAGGTFSRWAMRRPVIAETINKIPKYLGGSITGDIVAGRIADIGESVANSVEYAIQAGSGWEAIKAFPTALIANMAEELIIDIPGMKSGFSRRGRMDLKLNRLADIEDMRQGLMSRRDSSSGDERNTLNETIKRWDNMKADVVSKLRKDVKAELSNPNSPLSKNKDKVVQDVNRLIALGRDEDTALEEAVTALYVKDIEGNVASKEIDKVTGDIAMHNLNYAERAGQYVLSSIGRKTKKFQEEKEKIAKKIEGEIDESLVSQDFLTPVSDEDVKKLFADEQDEVPFGEDVEKLAAEERGEEYTEPEKQGLYEGAVVTAGDRNNRGTVIKVGETKSTVEFYNKRTNRTATKELDNALLTVRKTRENYAVTPAISTKDKSFGEFIEDLPKEARKIWDDINTAKTLGDHAVTKRSIKVEGKKEPLKIKENFLLQFETTETLNKMIEADPAKRELMQGVYKALKGKVTDAEFNLKPDGTFDIKGFDAANLAKTKKGDKPFAIKRSVMQRIIDALPPEHISSLYKLPNGKIVKLSEKDTVPAPGGEVLRREILRKNRRLFRDGKLKESSIGTIASPDEYGTMSFLAENEKTIASGDFTTLCPQIFFNGGCFYCYRRSQLETNVNNKLGAAKVWYTGEILRLTEDDIKLLNQSGGLRVQSFGDWFTVGAETKSQFIDMVIDAQVKGLQVKVITKTAAFIDFVGDIKAQGFGGNIFFNISTDSVWEKYPLPDGIDANEFSHPNYGREFKDVIEDGKKVWYWKRALSVEEAFEYKKKYPWVNIRTVALNVAEFVRDLADPRVDVVTGYHGHLNNFESLDENGKPADIMIEPIGDAGMPRFDSDGNWYFLRETRKVQEGDKVLTKKENNSIDNRIRRSQYSESQLKSLRASEAAKRRAKDKKAVEAARVKAKKQLDPAYVESLNEFELEDILYEAGESVKPLVPVLRRDKFGIKKPHIALAEAIQQAGLQDEYYRKACCIAGNCTQCTTICGAMRMAKYLLAEMNLREYIGKEWKDYFNVENGEDKPLKGSAYITLKKYLDRLPQYQRVLEYRINNKIRINPEAFFREYGRRYKGERALGKTTIFEFDAHAWIEVADDASAIVGHEEFGHFLFETVLTDTQREYIYSLFPTIHDAVFGYAQWAEREETRTLLGKAFDRIKTFINKIFNLMKGDGFTSAEDMFTKLYYGKKIEAKQAKVYRDRYAGKWFIDQEGKRIGVVNFNASPEAYENNWIRKDVSYNGIEYGVKDLDNRTMNDIQKDLRRYNPKVVSPSPVILEGSGRYFFFDTQQFFDNDQSLSKTLAQAISKEISGKREFYGKKTDGITSETPTGYENVPNALMGYSEEGNYQKGFDETKYKVTLPVMIEFNDGTSISDEIKGMNKKHAMERAKRNWVSAVRIVEATGEREFYSENLFDMLANAQRGEPESAMRDVQKAMNSGVLNLVVEHVGDLTHRMSESTTQSSRGYEYVKHKVNLALSILKRPYGFTREMRENITANFPRSGFAHELLYKNHLNNLLDSYAFEHSKLPVFNEVQRIARDAAVAVGREEWTNAIRLLERLESILNKGQSAWVKEANKIDDAQRESYALDSIDDPVAEAKKYTSMRGLMDMPKDLWDSLKEQYKHHKAKRGDDPFNFVERWLGLPDLLKRKSAALREMITAQYQRERQRQIMNDHLLGILQPLRMLPPEKMAEAREMILLADARGRDLTEAEIGEYSAEAAAGYQASRDVMEKILGFEIKWLHKQYLEVAEYQDKDEDGFPVKSPRMNQLLEQIKYYVELRNKGYFPHVFGENARYYLRFEVKPSDMSQAQRDAFTNAIASLGGEAAYWSGRAKDQIVTADIDDVVGVRFDYETEAAWKKDQAILDRTIIGGTEEKPKFLKVTSAPVKHDPNRFNTEMTRQDIQNIVDELAEMTKRSASIKNMDQKVTEDVLDILLRQKEVLDKATGFNKHYLKREGVLGYETKDMLGVIESHISGFSGLYTKRETAKDLMKIFATIPVANQNERGVAQQFINTVLHNRTKWDEIQGRLTGLLFTKYLAFNVPFHIRNRWQPWYLGVPVLAKRIAEIRGLKSNEIGARSKLVLEIAKHMGAVQIDMRWLETYLLKNVITLDKESKLAQQIKGLRTGETDDILYALDHGIIDEQMREEFRQAYQKQINETKAHKAMGSLLKWAGNWIQASDAKNRIQVYLAAIRSGASRGEALDMTREANVVYKGWNAPGIFAPGQFLNRFKFAFPFQKFLWHATEWQLRNGLRGMLGATMGYWLMSALLGGKEGIPLKRWLEKLFGVDNAAAMRKSLVDSVGGNATLLELWDTGLLSTLGIDMSTQFMVKPFSVTDPVFGENALFRTIGQFKDMADSVSRGRYWKGLLVDNPVVPNVFSRPIKAFLKKKEGLTTKRGDLVFDFEGKPLTLTVGDLFKMSLGFMPSRLSKHYRARNDVRDLIEYYSAEKSKLGTRYKMAKNARNKNELDSVRELIDSFNQELRDGMINGETPVPEISAQTLKTWIRGADTERIRKLSRELYP